MALKMRKNIGKVRFSQQKTGRAYCAGVKKMPARNLHRQTYIKRKLQEKTAFLRKWGHGKAPNKCHEGRTGQRDESEV